MTSQQPYTVPATQTVPLPVRESTQATSFPVTNVPRKLSTLPMTLSQLLPQLLAAKMITPIPPRPLTDPPPRNHNPNATCDYHMGAPGHWTDRCYNLRHRVQDLIDKELLNFEPPEVKPNVMQNPLPTHVDDKPNSSSNSINDQEKGFDPSQLITLPGAVVRVWLDKEQGQPEIAMITADRSTRKGSPRVRSVVRIERRRKFDSLPLPQSQLLPDLLEAGLITPVPANPPPSPLPKGYNPNARCEYHAQGAGHWTYDCKDLKHKIQDLLDQGVWSPPSYETLSKSTVFDPSRVITRPQFEAEEDFSEVNMIRQEDPPKVQLNQPTAASVILLIRQGLRI